MKITLTQNLTTNFSVNELFVNQKNVSIPYETLIKAYNHALRLERFRKYKGKALSVNAWFRTSAYNKSVGGISTSLHLTGEATDISMQTTLDTFKTDAKRWTEICEKDGVFAEIIWYKTSGFVHFGSNYKGKSHYIGINENGKLRKI